MKLRCLRLTEFVHKSAARLMAGLLLVLPVAGFGQDDADHSAHAGHQMTVDKAGVVMNENQSSLPRGCSGVSHEVAVTVRAGREYAQAFPGMVFGMEPREVRVRPCSRVTVTFVNEDQVRHQWMVHGLPKYLYPAGMFHIEASGGHSMTGTFIVPSDHQTYLLHCDVSQHMEKGMRGQLVVGKGSGDLWGVAGVSDEFYRSSYQPRFTIWLSILVLVLAFVITFHVIRKP
jgi:plastocyanin